MSSYQIKGLQDIRAIEKTPLKERLPAESSYGLLQYAAREFKTNDALTFAPQALPDEEVQTLTYAQLLEEVNAAANAFHSLGVGPTDTVGYLLPNMIETFTVLFAAEACGIAAPVNPLQEPHVIASILNAAEARVLVIPGPGLSPEIWAKATPVIAQTSSLTHVVAIGEAPDSVHNLPVLNFSALCAAQPRTHLLSKREVRGSDIASYFHTGGTTGVPKLAMHTHFNEVADAVVSGLMLNSPPGSVFLCGLPLFHVNAVVITGTLSFSTGGHVVLLSSSGFRDPNVINNFWKLVERYKANFFSAVPTVYAALMNVPVDGADISSLTYALCGAAPMPVELFRKVEERFNLKILEGYGLTEGTCANAVNPNSGERRIGSIGFGYPYQETITAKVDEHNRIIRRCEANEQGVLLIRGPYVFAGYKQARFNKQAFTDCGFLNTGDLARIDEDGYIWLTGRAKDLIIRGGHNIDPSVIEEVLTQHPAVAVAAAVGQPDAYAGELPAAFVQLVPGASASLEELLGYARANIGERAAVPVHIQVLENMPLTTVGKVFKPELRKLATHRVLNDRLQEAGVAAEMQVVDHPRFGMMARVTTPKPEEAGEVLGQFHVRFEVNGESSV